jgi:ribosomal protein S18 acetylase RimI-like enzyme
MATLTTSLPITSEHLRPFDVGRDLSAVADLIEQCFAATLDADGRRYLRQMRAAARSARFLRWASQVSERAATPLSGYVWEEQGRVVGNLSLIPFHNRGRRIYLIANVAVEPAYRQRGIARALTRAALEDTARRRAEAIWLQVRDDNPAAYQLYASLGFAEVCRRATWHSRPVSPPPPPASIVIGAQQGRYWTQQQAWFARAYPPELNWYHPLQLNSLRPGLWGFFHRLLNDIYLRQVSAALDGKLVGLLTWQATHQFADALWLSADPAYEAQAAQALLAHAVQRFGRRRPLALEYPAGQSAEAIQSAGFQLHQTLIWMRRANQSEPEVV